MRLLWAYIRDRLLQPVTGLQSTHAYLIWALMDKVHLFARRNNYIHFNAFSNLCFLAWNIKRRLYIMLGQYSSPIRVIKYSTSWTNATIIVGRNVPYRLNNMQIGYLDFFHPEKVLTRCKIQKVWLVTWQVLKATQVQHSHVRRLTSCNLRWNSNYYFYHRYVDTVASNLVFDTSFVVAFCIVTNIHTSEAPSSIFVTLLPIIRLIHTALELDMSRHIKIEAHTRQPL